MNLETSPEPRQNNIYHHENSLANIYLAYLKLKDLIHEDSETRTPEQNQAELKEKVETKVIAAMRALSTENCKRHLALLLTA